MHHAPPVPFNDLAFGKPAEAGRPASMDAVDATSESVLHTLARAAAGVCKTPMALVCLLDDDPGNGFKSVIGLPGFVAAPPDVALCCQALNGEGVFEVMDTARNARFAASPAFVGPPPVRSFAGAPIVLGDGQRLGALSVMDRRPRRFSAAQQEALIALAQVAAHEFESTRARREAQRSAEHLHRLALVARKTTNAVIITDTSRRITWVNEGFERNTGFRADEAIGRWPPDLLRCEESDPHVLERVREALKAGQQFKGEILNRCKNGQYYWCEIEVQPLRDAQGVLLGFMSIELDITERKATLARLENTARAQKAFIATVSHELRSPLQSVIGYAELGQLMTSDSTALGQLFAAVHAGGHRMLRLVNGLLDVAKIDGNVEALRLHREDLLALAAGVADEFMPLAAKREVRIALRQAAAGLSADVDGFRIQQVIRNLLSNALRFAPPGSVIEIEGVDRGEAGVELSVRDQGPGIPEDELEKVFDAFQQSSRTRHASEGTGLGLAICRKLMAAHGGCIRAAQAPGGGALIVLCLPQSTLPAGAPPPLPFPPTNVVHRALS